MMIWVAGIESFLFCKKYGAESFFFLIIPTLLFPSLVVKWALTSSTDNRSCRCRKAAGEESPGFTGQDAG